MYNEEIIYNQKFSIPYIIRKKKWYYSCFQFFMKKYGYTIEGTTSDKLH